MAHCTHNLPDELYDRAKKYADKNYLDVTTVLKLAIIEFLKRNEAFNTGGVPR